MTKKKFPDPKKRRQFNDYNAVSSYGCVDAEFDDNESYELELRERMLDRGRY
jgi:hypothetical protein